jgi:hypothetical protein
MPRPANTGSINRNMRGSKITFCQRQAPNQRDIGRAIEDTTGVKEERLSRLSTDDTLALDILGSAPMARSHYGRGDGGSFGFHGSPGRIWVRVFSLAKLRGAGGGSMETRCSPMRAPVKSGWHVLVDLLRQLDGLVQGEPVIQLAIARDIGLPAR